MKCGSRSQTWRTFKRSYCDYWAKGSGKPTDETDEPQILGGQNPACLIEGGRSPRKAALPRQSFAERLLPPSVHELSRYRAVPTSAELAAHGPDSFQDGSGLSPSRSSAAPWSPGAPSP